MVTEPVNSRPGGGFASVRAFLESAFWERTLTALIIFNAITLGMETSPTIMAHAGGVLRLLDNIVLTIFVIEIATRMAVYGRDFWRDGWSWFDFVVVAIALLPTTGGFAVLRALRILRVLRLISTVRSVRRVVAGLLAAIPGMGAVITLLGLIFYVFSVMATKLFGQTNPDLFGTLGHSAYSLFQLMTLENWPDMARQVQEHHPSSWVFFIIFILVTAFIILNLFIGIIVDSMQVEQETEMRQDRIRAEDNFVEVLSEIRALRAEIGALRAQQQLGDNPHKAS